MYRTLNRWFERLLQVASIAILLSLAVIVVLAVIYRFSGASLIWYDEVASVVLAWLTYYGSALAVCNRGHLGFPGLFLSFPRRLRAITFIFAEVVVIGFFAVIGYAGWYVMGIFGDETLVSLSWVHLSFTQSVIPVGAVLFIMAEILSIPDAWSKAIAGIDYEKEMIDQAIEEAKQS